jgi:hypothetical protein
MDIPVLAAYSATVNSSGLRGSSLPIRAIALSSASSACFVFIVVVRIHWFDVGDRLQDAHRGDPSVTFLDYIPSLPCSCLLVNHSIQEAIAPR